MATSRSEPPHPSVVFCVWTALRLTLTPGRATGQRPPEAKMPALPGSALVEAQVWAAVAVARKRGLGRAPLWSLPPFAVEPLKPSPGLEGVTVLQWCRTTLPVQATRLSVEASPPCLIPKVHVCGKWRTRSLGVVKMAPQDKVDCPHGLPNKERVSLAQADPTPQRVFLWIFRKSAAKPKIMRLAQSPETLNSDLRHLVLGPRLSKSKHVDMSLQSKAQDIQIATACGAVGWGGTKPS